MATKESLPADVYGEAMHTAMRKLMDSTPSSYAWNVVHLLSETWVAFCDAAARADARTGAALKEVWKARHGRDGWWVDPQQRTRESFYARQMFEMAMDDFEDNEWDALAGYLEEE